MRRAIDDGTIKIKHTGGQTPGFAQCNLAILPKKYAFDFLMFCHRNPKSCPLIEVLEPGQYQYGDIDLRKHVHAYRIFDGKEWSDKKGQSISDLTDIWRDDLVTFMLGCSFSFEEGF